MENFCKPKIDEKHYSYADRSLEQNIRNDTARPEAKNIECRKRPIAGLFKKAENGDAPEILVCFFKLSMCVLFDLI